MVIFQPTFFSFKNSCSDPFRLIKMGSRSVHETFFFKLTTNASMTLFFIKASVTRINFFFFFSRYLTSYYIIKITHLHKKSHSTSIYFFLLQPWHGLHKNNHTFLNEPTWKWKIRETFTNQVFQSSSPLFSPSFRSRYHWKTPEFES